METIDELRTKSQLPVIITDHQGIVLEVNSHFEAVFGWSTAEVVGQSLTIILPVYFRDSHHLGFSRFTATGISTILNHPLKLKALTKDRGEVLSEHFIIAEQKNGNWVFAATLRPLTEEENS
ncbi:MAG: PAS domain S-box protein [Cyanobacteria bacterium RI_101]|nr:PAS domain S-box protein [Cyanobacteria bacterium RI_101]